MGSGGACGDASADDRSCLLREDVHHKTIDGREVGDVRRHVPSVVKSTPAKIDMNVEVVAGIAVPVHDCGMSSGRAVDGHGERGAGIAVWDDGLLQFVK